jgi:hypothetical protein
MWNYKAYSQRMLLYKLNMQNPKLTIKKHTVLLETSQTSLLVLPVFRETTKFGRVTELLSYRHHADRNRTMSLKLYTTEGLVTGTMDWVINLLQHKIVSLRIISISPTS